MYFTGPIYTYLYVHVEREDILFASCYIYFILHPKSLCITISFCMTSDFYGPEHCYIDIYETFLDTYVCPSVHLVSSAESSILMCKTTFRTFLKLVSEGLVFFCCPPEKISCEVQFCTEGRET